MVKLQDEILAKELAQARALHRRCDERTVRFMNAKKRTIGVDRNELDRQLVEKEQHHQAEKEASKDEGKLLSFLPSRLRACSRLQPRDNIICSSRMCKT